MARDYVEQREGNFYIAGTRVSLDSIVHGFRRGESPETICQNFDVLDLEEVYGAIAYYLAHQAEIDVHLSAKDAQWADGKRDSPELPPSLRERLARAREELHSPRSS